MRRSRDFRCLERLVVHRIGRLRTKAVAALPMGSHLRDREFAYVVLEIHNLWSNFARTYVLSCIGRPRRAGGGKVSCGNMSICTPADVIWAAAKIARGPLAPPPSERRDEPKWHEVSLLHKTCKEMQCSHLADVQAALSLPARVFHDLPTFRNFYAHRNEETAAKALSLARQNYLIVGHSHPSTALAAVPGTRPQCLLLDWIDELETVCSLLCH
jgi:hypothetical protein